MRDFKLIYEVNFMKKSRTVCLLSFLFSFILSSCSLLPGINPTSRRSKSSSGADTSQKTNAPSDHVHKWGDRVTVVAPTCTDFGKQERECERCGHRFSTFERI